MSREKNIVVFTNTYPYITEGNAEATILNSLTPVLAGLFDKVVLVPSEKGRCTIRLDQNIVLAESLAELKANRFMKMCYALFALRVYKEFLTHSGGKTLWVRRLRELVGYWGSAMIVKRWCERSPELSLLSPKNTVLFSFWFDTNTLGAAIYGKLRGYPVLTCAHGYDLFEFRHLFQRIPFRSLAMELVDGIYPVSHDGARYLHENYPQQGKKIKTFLTGTVDLGVISFASRDEVFRVLSISRTDSVKRLDDILEAVVIFAQRNPSKTIRWCHIGGGPELQEYRQKAAKKLNNNIQFCFYGEINNEIERRNFYTTNPVDCFVNFSASEGTSVAIMEAMSVGIPVIASRVGGNVELLAGENGILLPDGASSVDLAVAFEHLLENTHLTHTYRENSRRHWEANYRAERNYSLLAEELMSALEVTDPANI